MTEPIAEERDAGVPPSAQEKPLRESLEDASVLLWYATREGKQIAKETVGDIVLAPFLGGFPGAGCGRPTGIGRLDFGDLQLSVRRLQQKRETKVSRRRSDQKEL